jgi:hypothetical protein
MSTINFIRVERSQTAWHGDDTLTFGGKPPGWLLDKWAEEKNNGGYKPNQLGRRNMCPTCNTVKTVTGACMCDL